MSKRRSLHHMPFFIVTIVINMGANFAHPVTPTIFKTLGLGDYMFGYALGAMMIVNFLFSPFWGKMNSLFSSRKCLFITCIGYALGQLMFGFAQTELQFILVRAFTGFFTGGVFVSILNYIINVSENETERANHLILSATIQAVAGAFGFLAGGVIGEINPVYSVFAQAIVLAGGGVLALFVCKEDRKEIRGQLTAKGFLHEANPFSAFINAKKFMTPALLVFFVVVILYSLAQVSFDQSFNYYITDKFQLTSGYNGAFKAIMGIITLIANSTVCLYLIRKTNIKRSSAVLFFLGSTMLLVAILMEMPVSFVVFSVVFFVFCSALLPLLQNIMAQEKSHEDSNLVMGFFSAMKSLGGIFGALMSGTLYAVNAKMPFAMCCIAFLLAGFGMIWFFKKSKKS